MEKEQNSKTEEKENNKIKSTESSEKDKEIKEVPKFSTKTISNSRLTCVFLYKLVFCLENEIIP